MNLIAQIEAGLQEPVEVTVLLEPVTDDFVAALALSSCGSQPCC